MSTQLYAKNRRTRYATVCGFGVKGGLESRKFDIVCFLYKSMKYPDQAQRSVA